MAEIVCIRITEGPVVLQNAPSEGLDDRYTLWDGIEATEFFPAGQNSANYVLTLEKSATSAGEVPAIESELEAALQMLAASWSFSGGSYMIIDTRAVVRTPRFESNAAEVRQRLLASEGLTRVSFSQTLALESGATYSRPPLRLASEIARLMRTDFEAEQMLQYFHQAYIDRSRWFIDLYKVFDVLKRRSRAIARTIGANPDDLSRFEKLLNNHDLRHAKHRPNSSAIANEDRDWLYATARQWIVAFLKVNELPVER